MKKIFCFFLLLVLASCLTFGAFAYTDGGTIYGDYSVNPSSVSVDTRTGFNVITFPISGSAVFSDGSVQVFSKILVSPSAITLFNTSNDSLTIWTSGSLWSVSEPFVLQLSEPYTFTSSAPSQMLASVFSQAEWLSAPEPFPDSISTSLDALLLSFSSVLLSLVSSAGALSALLPLVGISVALSIGLLVFVLVRRSTK